MPFLKDQLGVDLAYYPDTDTYDWSEARKGQVAGLATDVAALSGASAPQSFSNQTAQQASTAVAGSIGVRTDLAVPIAKGTSRWFHGNAKRYLVTEYGAMCDGSTDDTNAWLAAIAAAEATGGTIEFSGVTRVRRTLLLTASASYNADNTNVRIVGQDPASSVILWDPQAAQYAANCVHFDGSAMPYLNGGMSNVRILAAPAVATLVTGTGLYVDQGLLQVFSSVYINNFAGTGARGAYIGGVGASQDIALIDVQVYGCYMGMQWDGLNAAYCFGLSINQNNVYGLYITSCAAVGWYGGVMQGNLTYGVRFASAAGAPSHDFSMYNVHVEATCSGGMISSTTDGAINLRFQDLHMSGAALATQLHFDLRNCDRVVIDNCRQFYGGSDILLKGRSLTRCAVTNCDINDAPDINIDLDSTCDVSFGSGVDAARYSAMVGCGLSYFSTTEVSAANGTAPPTNTTGRTVRPMVYSLGGGNSVNFAINGQSGLDTGSVAAATKYALWLMSPAQTNNYTSGSTRVVASTSFTWAGVTKTNIASYTLSRYLGSVLTKTGSATILPFTQETNGGRRTTRFTEYDAALAVLAAGTQTSDTSVSLSAVVPSTATHVILGYVLTAGAATATAELGTFGGTYTNLNTLKAIALGFASGEIVLPVTTQAIGYLVAGASASLRLVVKGYIEAV